MSPLHRIIRRNLTLFALVASANVASAATVSIDTSPNGQQQVIDGFGTTIGNDLGKDAAFQRLYFDDLGCSIVRMDLTPRFVAPYSDANYNSPWFYNSPKILTFPPGTPADDAHSGGPEHNNARTYTGPEDYGRDFGGEKASIAVMGPDIDENIKKFNLSETGAIAMAKAAAARKTQLGDFKLYGSIWSPAPWVKRANGDIWNEVSDVRPSKGTPYPFIWGGNFAGGSVDVSNTPLEIFNDGTGPTSALTQFARSTAAYIKGLQDQNGVHFYGISIQNEINFPEFYNSSTYRLSSQYIAAIKAVRAEFDKYPDLKTIRLIGPEDLLGGDVWGMWQLGGGDRTTHKNLQYLQNIAADPQAAKALELFCVHGYAPDGASAAGADPTQWNWWARGWQQGPKPGIPANIKGFTNYGKRSWMTETSGEQDAWLAPANGFPKNGAFSVALKIQQALTAGQESAWLYWQFAEKDETTTSCLTGKTERENAPKYIAAKHFFKFIRPGAMRVQTTIPDAPNLTASAFVQPQDKTLTMVLVNSGTEAQTANVAFSQQGANWKSFTVYTSQNEKLWQNSTAQSANGKLKVEVPPYGVVTCYAKSE